MRKAEPRAISFVSHWETGTQPGGKKTSVSATTFTILCHVPESLNPEVLENRWLD